MASASAVGMLCLHLLPESLAAEVSWSVQTAHGGTQTRPGDPLMQGRPSFPLCGEGGHFPSVLSCLYIYASYKPKLCLLKKKKIKCIHLFRNV